MDIRANETSEPGWEVTTRERWASGWRRENTESSSHITSLILLGWLPWHRVSEFVTQHNGRNPFECIKRHTSTRYVSVRFYHAYSWNQNRSQKRGSIGWDFVLLFQCYLSWHSSINIRVSATTVQSVRLSLIAPPTPIIWPPPAVTRVRGVITSPLTDKAPISIQETGNNLGKGNHWTQVIKPPEGIILHPPLTTLLPPLTTLLPLMNTIHPESDTPHLVKITPLPQPQTTPPQLSTRAGSPRLIGGRSGPGPQIRNHTPFMKLLLLESYHSLTKKVFFSSKLSWMRVLSTFVLVKLLRILSQMSKNTW